MSEPSVPSDIDALFQLPLGEFTAARNALAAQLKKAGRTAEANEAKGLAKPSASAWAVNQLFWRHRKSFDRLIDAGERLRRAHAARLTGDAAREPVNARREVIAELSAIAEQILREGDHNATRDLLRRVTSTLEALSTYASLPGAPAAGRLIDDLEPPGFEAVAGLLPEGAKGAAAGAQIQMRLPHAELAAKPASAASAASRADVVRRDNEERKRVLVAAKAAVRDAERNLNVALKQAERAAANLATAAKRAKGAAAQRASIEKQLARAAEDAEEAQERMRESEAHAEEAARAKESADRDFEMARARLQRLEDERAAIG